MWHSYLPLSIERGVDRGISWYHARFWTLPFFHTLAQTRRQNNMAEELKRYLMQLKNSVSGLSAIIITDRDGVPVLKVADDNAPELVMRQNFLSTFGLATEQAGKLGLSENKSVISMYSTCQIIQINYLPFLITLVASISANTGLLLNVPNEMKEVLKDLESVLCLV